AGRGTGLRSPENLGYAGGANLGIRAALAAGADVVLVLNNDVRLRPGAAAAALEALGADRRIAAVGPKVLAREDPSRLWLAWGEVTWRQSLVALRGAGEPDGPAWDAPRDVEWIAGCAMWIRREALAAVGLLDETFFAYHEEVDWCARARAAGWRVVYRPAAVVTHTGRGGAGRGGAAPLAAGLVVAAYTAALRRYGVFDPVDEGLLLVQALRTAHGQVPYVDFHTGYGPLYFRLQAWLLEAGGWDAIRWGLVAV